MYCFCRILFKEMWFKELWISFKISQKKSGLQNYVLVSKLAKKRIAYNHITRNSINIKTKKCVEQSEKDGGNNQSRLVKVKILSNKKN